MDLYLEQGAKPFYSQSSFGARDPEQQNSRFNRPSHDRNTLESRSRVKFMCEKAFGESMAEKEQTPCCAASRSGDQKSDQSREQSQKEENSKSVDISRMVKVPSGEFVMGTDSNIGFPQDGEGPTREVYTDSFYIDQHAVTNAEFYQFVSETGYTTDAEQYGWSFVFENFLSEEDEKHVVGAVDSAPWWTAVEGACWFRPDGPSSTIEDKLTHPVTHISWEDAVAYAEWAGKRLPTEAEWEKAARGGLHQATYPWGDELRPDGDHRCNIWQGDFPDHNTGDDGFTSTCSVDEFNQNGYDMYNVSGNVWEWCSDWFSPDYHTSETYDSINPTGPDTGDARVMRGGSFLCHRSWCNRYRVAARSKNTPRSSTANIGFRTAVDINAV